jgi:hypothetical protein
VSRSRPSGPNAIVGWSSIQDASSIGAIGGCTKYSTGVVREATTVPFDRTSTRAG